jgi:hypothetical protein
MPTVPANPYATALAASSAMAAITGPAQAVRPQEPSTVLAHARAAETWPFPDGAA